jgi:hypothetical protein
VDPTSRPCRLDSRINVGPCGPRRLASKSTFSRYILHDSLQRDPAYRSVQQMVLRLAPDPPGRICMQERAYASKLLQAYRRNWRIILLLTTSTSNQSPSFHPKVRERSCQVTPTAYRSGYLGAFNSPSMYVSSVNAWHGPDSVVDEAAIQHLFISDDARGRIQ